MENKKYEFTGETKEFCDYTLHRIRALVDIVDIENTVRKGELGGWIESEENLSHEGNCWVGEGCHVCGGARVYENAHVMGNSFVMLGSEVYGDAYVIDRAEVTHNSKVYGSAVVMGNSIVNGADVYDHATIASNAVVSDGAEVFGTAVVNYGANVNGKVTVRKSANVSGKIILTDGDIDSTFDFICVGPIGSRSAYTTYNLKTGTVCTGCFVGTLEEFEKQVISTYGADGGEDIHYKSYKNLIEYFKTIPLRTTEQEKD